MYSNILVLSGLSYVLFVLYSLYKLLRFGHRDKRLPPGPPTVPVLGNAHLIPSNGVHLKFKEWSDQYGPVFSLKVGASTIVVLNDRRAVHDLIDKKSAIYSDRARDVNTYEVLGGENFGFMDANTRWRAQRKVAAQYMSPRAIDDKIAPIQEAEICQLVYDLLKTPDQFFAHVKRTTASVAAIVIFGHRAPTIENFWAKCVYDSMAILNPALEPGSYLPIEQFPILSYIPDFLAPSKARAKEAYQKSTAIYTDARCRIEARRRDGDERNSIADRVLSGDIKMDSKMTPTETSNFFGVLHEAGSDTTSSMTLTAILYLAKYPWVQKKAQDELDRVCGNRMPTWNDFNELPYINCIVKEGLRIRPVVPVGIPHRVNRDDWYDGCLIPKDSTVYIPPHTLNSQLDDAEVYNPDRYLNHPRLAMDYAGSPDYLNRDHYTYGSGRRICVGIHLAERTQWRIIARLLWAFKIEPGLGETGKSIELDLKYDEGFLVQPAPFKARFTPRSEHHAKVICRNFESVESTLKNWE